MRTGTRSFAQGDLGTPDSAVAPADFQEVRWIETMALRQDQGWATYFAIHGITPVVVSYEDLVAEPVAAALTVVGQLGYEPSTVPVSAAREEAVDEVAARLAEQYRRAWPGLSRAIGVRRTTA